jgi:gamma-glutamyltranspeptidase
MGGASQPQINAQNLIRAFDLDMGAGQTIAAPRWTVWGDRGDGIVQAEGSVPEAVTSRFAEAGFRIDLLDDVDESVGHAHMIIPRQDGTLEVGSDPRADGGALAL